jgi:hypothetical protein
LNVKRSLAADLLTSNIAIDQDFVSDVFGNAFSALAATSAVGVSAFTPDSTLPALLSFDADVNAGVFYLTFTEAIDSDSAVLTAFTLSNSVSGGLTVTPLAGEANVTWNVQTPRQLALSMEPSLLNRAKNMAGFGEEINATVMTLAAGFVSDFAGNPSILTAPTAANQIVQDGIPPNFESADLDMDQGILTLRFDETMRVSTLDVSLILIQDATKTVRLTTSTLAGGQGNSQTISVQLSREDLDSLQREKPLAHSLSSSFVTLEAGVAADMAGNPSNAINFQQVQTFTPDSSSPSLQEFSMDMNKGVLSLTFSEVVDVATAVRQLLQLLSAPNSATSLTLSP